MACILCRLICGPRQVAVMERWKESRWDEPNNGDSFFQKDQNRDALRAAHDVRRSEPTKAFKEFLRFAEQGSVWSMRQVGSSLILGLGAPIDKVAAEKWLRLAYEAGYDGAMLALAREYTIQKRFREAEDLLEPYATKNHTPSLYLLGWMFLRAGRNKSARKMLERASALGHLRAKWTLSSACMRAKFGIRSMPYGYKLARKTLNELERGGLPDEVALDAGHPQQA